jgi:uncharacterized membrane protein YkgB
MNFRRIKLRAARIERAFGGWTAQNAVGLTRIALGAVFLWFGLLKFCPGLCDVEVLAQRTLGLLTFHLLSPVTCMWVLGSVECGIGLCLLMGWFPRLAVLCLLAHMAGTFLPLALFPAECWKHFPYAPTLAGQYILKNMVLLSAGLVVGAQAFGRVRVASETRVLQWSRPSRRAV